ncbi:hypothetical protein RND81_02G215700 [Saponaria officinalis]|uniref:Uncharacterized protein n=1 Tax=Saponaria officinalis TaxID=3572 RepID=A0AAW1MVT7_SAPOF
MEDEHTRSTTTNNSKPTASKSEVISSAKVIMDAAKSAFANDNERIDKAKVAEAAANVLEATSHYGKFEDKSYGKLINKAEDYLHKYNSTHSTTTAATTDGGGGATEGHGGGGGDGKEGHGGGGYGEYLKMAQGIMSHGNNDNKHDGHDGVHHGHMKDDGIAHGGGGGGGGHGGDAHSSHSNSGGGGGGGYGEYVKFAQGILKK